ncbi:hypothetical protein [uncultured Massilia sp.]|uniref:hypothetical protein n=1 Tax=uncultured Massilia sp. TaxID=169973 RepID=UPI0025E9EB09|nr:hypothetical protein [uncultured Massilia sp.]
MVSRAFADVLAAGRAGFNECAREAARRHALFRPEAFARFLEEGVGAVADAVAAVQPARLPAVVSAAYGIALELAGRGLVGPQARANESAHEPALDAAWRALLPRYAALVAAQPERVLAMVSNAVLHLDTIPGARSGQWRAELAALAPQVATVAQLRVVGQVAAWRAGAAHFRAGAIAAAAALPEPLALRAFGAAAPSWAALRARIEQDPWWSAGDACAVRAREVGAFSGFGGQFAAPPQLRAGAGGFLVRAGERHFLLVADAYGAVLHAATAEEFAAGADGAEPDAVAQARRAAADLPQEGLAVCADASTVALASPYTHAIRLLARERGGKHD